MFPTVHQQDKGTRLDEEDGVRLVHLNAETDNGEPPQYAVDIRQKTGENREWGRCVSVFADILRSELQGELPLYYTCVYFRAHELLLLL